MFVKVKKTLIINKQMLPISRIINYQYKYSCLSIQHHSKLKSITNFITFNDLDMCVVVLSLYPHTVITSITNKTLHFLQIKWEWDGACKNMIIKCYKKKIICSSMSTDIYQSPKALRLDHLNGQSVIERTAVTSGQNMYNT